MAIGDIVNGVSAVSTALQFQPAIGVSICLKSVSNYNSWIRINDGTNSALCAGLGTLTVGTNMNTKIMIDNSVYLYIDSSSGQSSHYTGIQIA